MVVHFHGGDLRVAKKLGAIPTERGSAQPSSPSEPDLFLSGAEIGTPDAHHHTDGDGDVVAHLVVALDPTAPVSVHAALEAAVAAVGGVVEGHLPTRHHHTAVTSSSSASSSKFYGGGRGEEDGGAMAAAGVLVVGPTAATSAAVRAVDGVWGLIAMPRELKLDPELARWGGPEGDVREDCGGEGGLGGSGGGEGGGSDGVGDGEGGQGGYKTPRGAVARAAVQAVLVSSARDGVEGGGHVGGQRWSAVAARVAAEANEAGLGDRGSDSGGSSGNGGGGGGSTGGGGVGSGWTATSTDAGNVIVTAPCRAAAAAAARWLAARHEVLWVQPHAPVGRFANKFSRAVVAGGAVADPPAVPSAVDPPLWSAGIKGGNEVVGIGDSGLDMQSCFFRDSNNMNAGPNHRKVVMYRATSTGNLNDDHGHGTHCAGTLAGSPVDSSATSAIVPMTGLAPLAKLAVTDLGVGIADEMAVPTSMKDYYAPAWDVGARVHSDSWGEVSSGYTESSWQVDEVVGGGSTGGSGGG